MIKNIIFDLGGVVLGRDYAAQGESMQTFSFLRGEKFPDYWLDFDMGTATQEQVARAIAASEGITAEQADGMITSIRDHFTEFPHTVQLIKELHGEGYKLYVLSNMPAEFYDYMKSFDVFNYFDGVVISSTEKMSKPDPRFFRLLLERYGLTPEETLFVDDKQMNTSAASALGLHACLFDAAGSGCADVRRILEKENPDGRQ